MIYLITCLSLSQSNQKYPKNGIWKAATGMITLISMQKTLWHKSKKPLIISKMWKLINSLISSKEKSSWPPEKLFDPIKSNYTSNPEVMSSIFNTYFVSIGQQLASKIPPPVHHTYPVKVNGPKNSFVYFCWGGEYGNLQLTSL